MTACLEIGRKNNIQKYDKIYITFKDAYFNLLRKCVHIIFLNVVFHIGILSAVPLSYELV
jgi:hypothetical protein